MSDGLVFDHYPMRDTEPPAGWVMCGVGCVAESIASGFPSGAHNSEGRGVPHIRPMNIDREGRFDLTSVKSVDGEIPKLLAKGDVLFNNTNSPELIGKTTVIPIDDRLAYSNHMTRIRLEQGMNPSFVAKQLHFLWMSGYFRHRCKNHVNQASIAAEPLSRTVPLLVAPSQQQDRIADTLDELLSDLDAGVAALEKVRAKLRQYRAAVLKAAVSGELTAEWREKHPAEEPASILLERILAERRRRWEEAQLQKFQDAGRAPPKDWKAKYPQPVAPDTTKLPPLPAGWCWVTVDVTIVSPITNGVSVKGSDTPPGIAALRLSAMTENGFDFTKRRYLPLASNAVDDLWIQSGDFFVSRGNGSKKLVGRGTLAQDPNEKIIFPDTMMRLRVSPILRETNWIPAIWSSNMVRSQIERTAKTTAGIWKISQPDLAKIVIPLPPVNEQLAIVDLLDDQLSVIDHLESDLNTRLHSSTGLRQSILRHAFTGQLVPQDPSDEPASELLKRIAAEREERDRQFQAEKKSKPKTKTPRKRTPWPATSEPSMTRPEGSEQTSLGQSEVRQRRTQRRPR